MNSKKQSQGHSKNDHGRDNGKQMGNASKRGTMDSDKKESQSVNSKRGNNSQRNSGQ